MNERQLQERREQLSDFLRDCVFDGYTIDTIESIEGYISSYPEEEDVSSFCYYFDLGMWFEEALSNCNFDVKEFLAELRSDWEVAHAELVEEEAEKARDLRHMQGWPR